MGKGIKMGGGAENLKNELQTQDSLIVQLAETMVGKATGATATEDTILEGYSAYVGQTLVKGKATKTGSYVWEKRQSSGGVLLGYVVADDENAYPNGGYDGDYWYEKFEFNPMMFGFTKYAVNTVLYNVDTSGWNTELQHSLGEIPKFAMIFGNPYPYSSTTNYIHSACAMFGDANTGYFSDRTLNTSNTLITSVVSNYRTTVDSSKLAVYLTGSFKANVAYTLITMV